MFIPGPRGWLYFPFYPVVFEAELKLSISLASSISVKTTVRLTQASSCRRQLMILFAVELVFEVENILEII